MRKNYGILLAVLLICALSFIGCSSVSQVGGVDDSNVTVQDGKTDDSKGADDAGYIAKEQFKEFLDEHGYRAEVFFETEESAIISMLLFAGTGEILEETEDYYVVKMAAYEQLKIPMDLQEGDKISLVINAVTGEEQGWTCVTNEEGFPELESKGNPSYYGGGEPDENGLIPLYVDSEDAVCCYLGDCEVVVLKTAKDEILVAEEAREVTPEILENGYWTHVAFDENGYAAHLYFAGD